MNLRFVIFRRIRKHEEVWTLLGTPGVTLTREGRHAGRLDAQMRDALRKLVEKTLAHEVRALLPALTTRLEHVRLEVTLSGREGRRTLSGRCPIVLEERRAGTHHTMTLAYPPERKDLWFEPRAGESLADDATRVLHHALRDASLEDVEKLFTDGRDRLHTVSITATPKPPSIRAAREVTALHLEEETKSVLSTLAVDRTQLVEAMTPHELGAARSPHRERLASLVTGARKQSVIVVGESGVGKSTLLTRLTHDLLVAEDYPVHRNLDRVMHVFQISARQLIAGMIFIGQWEERCFRLLEEVRKRRAILLITDLASFGRTGRSRQSDRTLADVFRGPVARGEVTLLGELSPGELARLEEDAPAFASLFARVHLPAATKAETLPILLAAVREFERERKVEVEPGAVLRLLELSDSLTTTRQLPGAALDALRALDPSRGRPTKVLDVDDVLRAVGESKGLRAHLLDAAKPLRPSAILKRLGGRVLGQDSALNDAVDVIVRVKTGLNDPRRPYAAMLLVGPTGTGKTELAKSLAAYLYSQGGRLVRFDMGQYTGADALVRLIGDGADAPGSLTAAVIQKPFCVLLLDEVEKAHPRVMPLLLQLLDEGRLTGADGRTVDFRHAVVIMTSNLGGRSAPPVGFARDHDSSASDALRAVKQFFSPELFNRIDVVVPFQALALEHAVHIVRRELVRLCQRPGLRDRHTFVIPEPAAIAHIAREAFRAEDGARSLRRYLEDRVGSALAEIAARASDSALRIAHLRAEGSGFVIEEHALEGAPALPGRFALSGLLGKPASAVRAALPAVLSMLRALRESEDLPRIAAHISEALRSRQHDETLFSLDALRAELTSLHDELALVLSTPSEAPPQEARTSDVAVRRGYEGQRIVTPLRDRPPAARPSSHARLSEMLARAYFLRRSAARALQPGMHVVDVELVALTALARDDENDLLPALCRAYAEAHGQLDGFAVASSTGIEVGRDARALQKSLQRGGSSAVLRLSGLCARDFYAPEVGIHILQPRTFEPELVRVWVRASPPALTPEARVAELEAMRTAAADAALFVAPVTRVIRFESAGSSPGLCEVEDYPHAYMSEERVWTVDPALKPLWRLRMSREDP